MSTPALSINHVQKKYKNSVLALNDVTFDVAPGDFFCLLGPNGAGKTTLINLITSLVNKTSGEISVFDYDVDKALIDAKRCMGVVPQEINLPIFETGRDILIRQAGYYGIEGPEVAARADEYLKALYLWDKRNVKVNQLSGGMKRRLMVARALMNKPRLLILDEPTAGVDVEIRRNIWSFIKKLNADGMTILLTTHYLEEAENLCNKVALIDKGDIKYQGLLSAFIDQLDIETLVITPQYAVPELPSLEGLEVRRHGLDEIEIDVPKNMSFSEVSALLSSNGIDIYRVRNKVNRLEEMFMRVTTQELS